MNRRTLLKAIAAAAVVAVCGKADDSERTLYEVHYASTDYPYTYIATSEAHALECYRRDTRGCGWGDDEKLEVVRIDRDEPIEYLNDDDRIVTETAGEIADGAILGVMMFCDPHYC